jgi:resuscitation-promoting factor RpfB
MIRQRSVLAIALAGFVAPAIVLGYGRTNADAPSAAATVPPSAFRPIGTHPAAGVVPPTLVDPDVLDPAAAPQARPTPGIPAAPRVVVSVVQPKPKPKPVAKPVARSSGVPSVADAKAYALSRIGSTQFSCLDRLWTRESNWNPYSRNSSSGAYGIPQALPGDKMAIMGADWRTNPVTQVKWGLSYIANRYGTACNAWAHSQTYGWY